MRKLITLLAALTLVAPLMFYGCSGDDGERGPQGIQGNPGPAGGPGTGIVADETCVICHGAGKAENVTDVHRIGQTAGSMTVTIQSVTFGAPVDNNVPVTVGFTFAAKDSTGADITNKINLEQPAANTNSLPNNSTDNLAFIRFSLAQLTPGQNGSPDEWGGFVVSPGATGSGPFSTANRDGINGATFTYDNTSGVGTYKFRDNVIMLPEYKDNVVTRVFIQVSGVPITLFTSDPYFNAEGRRRPVANGLKDVVSGVGTQTAAPGAGYPVKNDVSTQACNNCHDPLAIHGGGRREYKACQVCHNAKLETAAGGSWDNGNLVNLIHKIHNSAGDPDPDSFFFMFFGVQDIGKLDPNNNFTKILFPQAINNCRTCHQGPVAADNTYDNFMNRPSRRACGACHFKVDFATGAGHDGGAMDDDSGCLNCHKTGGFAPSVTQAHAAKEGAPTTPNNPTIATGLKDVRYAISSATVDNTNAATVKFAILIDGVLANLGDNVITRPTGFSGGPSFLLAYTLPQDGVDAPADYNNLGKRAGQPQSVPIVGLPITAFDNASYTVKIADAFPPGAKMRAVALQGYFTQTSVAGIDVNPDDGVPDNVARHTPSVQIAVTGDAVRRTVVKSGYNATTGKPEGCLECHEVFEGHGGNRVNNVQVCVMCHNPNLTSSARTFQPGELKNQAIIDFFGTSDPLQFPEVANNFKELIHGLHSSEDMRVNEFVDVRNFRGGNLLLGDEILYPGDLSHCTKCHVGTTYQNVQVPNSLLTTERIAGETVDQVIAGRASVPNDNDLVSSATASACGYCHDTPTDVSHFRTMGGDIKSTRADAKVAPPPLAPLVGP